MARRFVPVISHSRAYSFAVNMKNDFHTASDLGLEGLGTRLRVTSMRQKLDRALSNISPQD